MSSSHKGNYACPTEIRQGLVHTENVVRQVSCKAGDCVIFTEATTHVRVRRHDVFFVQPARRIAADVERRECCLHGTLPWTAEHERRNLIVRYTPGNTVCECRRV